MSTRRQRLSASFFVPFKKLRPFAAVREKIKEGYGWSDLRADLSSGAVVAMVAVPLGMALAIASGVPPQHGLYTVIIGGGVVALLGGSRFQVTGPTAAFVVILAPIAKQFGLGGLLVAGMLAGIILILMGMARMGRFIQFIPHPVTTGFTAGIAVVISTLQLKDFFGLRMAEFPESYTGKVVALFQVRSSASWIEFGIGMLTLLILIYWPKLTRRVPSPLISLGFMAVLTAFLKTSFPELEIATIGTRFIGGVPQTAPILDLPWNFTMAGGRPFELSFASVQTLFPSAFAIAMLGAIESLLSAVVADGMAQTKHDPDAELLAVGTGNLLCPFFGGIAATGAIARTATNIRFGAKSPLSAVFHAVFTVLVILIFAPYVSYLPMASLAALLMLVAYNMSEMKHFFHILKVAPKSDVIVLLLCFSLTVIFDMVVGVTVGVVLASLLFMNRMASVTSAHLLSSQGPIQLKEPLPNQIILYEIEGPLFFGAAQTAADAITSITDNVRAVIFSMGGVSVMDVTGLVAFESTITKLTRHHRHVFLVDVRNQPLALLTKDDVLRSNPLVHLNRSLDEAIRSAKEITA